MYPYPYRMETLSNLNQITITKKRYLIIIIGMRGTIMPISGNMNTNPILAFAACGVDNGVGASGGSGQVQAQIRRESVRYSALRPKLIGPY